MQLAHQSVNEHFSQAISNVRHIHPRPPLTEDAKAVLMRILADKDTKLKSGYRRTLEVMCEAS